MRTITRRYFVAAGVIVPCILSGTVISGSPALQAAVAGEVPPIRLSAEHLSLGSSTVKPEGNGLKVTFAKADWPSVWFRAGKAYDSPDMSAMGGIAFEVHNPNDMPLTVFIRVDDSPEADGQKHCRTGNATLAPNETATLVFPFSGEVKGMRAGPPLVPRTDKSLSH